MSVVSPEPRRRRLWTLFLMPALVLVLAILWSGFWFYAANQASERLDAWREQEAKSGRVFECGDRSIAGFPFRLEVRCSGASVALVSQTAGQDAREPVNVKLSGLLAVAQIYDPQKMIVEFSAPASVADGSSPPSLFVNWSRARASATGLPQTPDRGSLVFDDPVVEQVRPEGRTVVGRGKLVELHGRIAEGSARENPVVETAFQAEALSLPDVHPVLAEPFSADIRALLRGLNNLTPKPWPERFRQLQAAGGRIEITRSRIQQGDLLAIASGSLGLTESGKLDGLLSITVAGIDTVIPKLGLDQLLQSQGTLDRVAPGVKSDDVNKVLGALDRMIPGLGRTARQSVNASASAGIAMLGQPATLEGRKALALPLRFVDGAVHIGPLKVGEVPPLF